MVDYLRIGEVAQRVGVSVDTLRRWEAEGRIAFERRGNQRVLPAGELAGFLTSLDRLVWPRDRLEIKLVCEADDAATLAAIRQQKLPRHVEVIEVPPSLPRTKPKALAYALPLTGGEFVTLYDAEAPGALLINIAVFGATVSYVLMNLSHIVLRRKEPNMERPYRTPGGAITTGIALVLSAVAVVATFVVDILAAGITAIVFLAFIAYFWFYSRHRIVGGAPEEEFAAITAAEADLK